MINNIVELSGVVTALILYLDKSGTKGRIPLDDIMLALVTEYPDRTEMHIDNLVEPTGDWYERKKGAQHIVWNKSNEIVIGVVVCFISGLPILFLPKHVEVGNCIQFDSELPDAFEFTFE